MINCIQTDDLNALVQLHQQGADFLLQDAAGCTLLHHAVEAGNTEILKFLVDRVPSSYLDVTERATGDTALHKAASSGQTGLCRQLVEAGASLLKTDLQGETPKQRAERAAAAELAEYLDPRHRYHTIANEDQETVV